MLSIVLVALVAFWALGLATSHTFGGLVHLLLIAAIVLVLVRVVTGRRLLGE